MNTTAIADLPELNVGPFAVDVVAGPRDSFAIARHGRVGSEVEKSVTEFVSCLKRPSHLDGLL